jgi:hypothetical protein
MSRLSTRCGSLNLSHPYGPSRPLTGPGTASLKYQYSHPLKLVGSEEVRCAWRRPTFLKCTLYINSAIHIQLDDSLTKKKSSTPTTLFCSNWKSYFLFVITGVNAARREATFSEDCSCHFSVPLWKFWGNTLNRTQLLPLLSKFVPLTNIKAQFGILKMININILQS